jgi:hypothetical protein
VHRGISKSERLNKTTFDVFGGGFVHILAQGFVGLTDLFIHPSYMSSVSPLDPGNTGGFIGFMLAVVLIGVGTYLYLYYREKRQRWERAEALLREKGPP